MQTYRVTVNGNLYEVQLGDPFAVAGEVIVNGERYVVTFEEPEVYAEPVVAVVPPPSRPVAAPAPAPTARVAPDPAPVPAPAAPANPVASGEDVVAPMPGKVLAVRVAVGDAVHKGDEVLTLEAMKMAMAVRSTADGVVREVRVSQGQSVRHGEVLLVIG